MGLLLLLAWCLGLQREFLEMTQAYIRLLEESALKIFSQNNFEIQGTRHLFYGMQRILSSLVENYAQDCLPKVTCVSFITGQKEVASNPFFVFKPLFPAPKQHEIVARLEIQMN